MRANHAHPASPESAEPLPALPVPGPRRLARRPGRPRPGTIAAGGAVLAAQVWGLGLGTVDACAADALHVRATTRTAGPADGTAPAGSGPRGTRAGRGRAEAGGAGAVGAGAVAGGPGGARSGGARSGGTDASGTGAGGTGVRSGRAGGDPGGPGAAPGLVGEVAGGGAPVGLGDPVGAAGAGAGAVLQHPVGSVEQVLQDRIRTDGLPLPGQAAAVPDAFAIATVLLPDIPLQARGEDAARASRSGATAGAGRPATADEPDAALPDRRAPGSAVLPAADRGTTALAGPAGSGPLAGGPGDPEEGSAADELALAAAPARRDGGESAAAVLVPIAAGLLLTGAATYKHRGLPGGH